MALSRALGKVVIDGLEFLAEYGYGSLGGQRAVSKGNDQCQLALARRIAGDGQQPRIRPVARAHGSLGRRRSGIHRDIRIRRDRKGLPVDRRAGSKLPALSYEHRQLRVHSQRRCHTLAGNLQKINSPRQNRPIFRQPVSCAVRPFGQIDHTPFYRRQSPGVFGVGAVLGGGHAVDQKLGRAAVRGLAAGEADLIEARLLYCKEDPQLRGRVLVSHPLPRA